MKKLILSIALAAAMLLSASVSYAVPHIYTKDADLYESDKSNTPNETNVTVTGANVHQYKDIITAIENYGDIQSSSTVLLNNASLNVDGNIDISFDNVQSALYFAGYGLILANNSNLSVGNKVNFCHYGGDKFAGLIIDFNQSGADRKSLSIADLEVQTLIDGINGSSEVHGISPLGNGSAGLDINVARDVYLDSMADGDASAFGIEFVSKLPNDVTSNINVGGKITAKAESTNTGYAEATGLSVNDGTSSLEGNINSVLNQGFLVKATSNIGDAEAAGLDIYGADQAGDGSVHMDLKGSADAQASSEYGDAEAKGIGITGSAVNIIYNNAVSGPALSVPQKALLSVSATAANGDATATAAAIDGSSGLVGNPDISATAIATAIGNSAEAWGATANDQALLELGNIYVLARGKDSAVTTGIRALESEVTCGNITVNSEGDKASADAIHAYGSDAIVNAGNIFASSILNNLDLAAGSTAIYADGGAKVNAGNLTVNSQNGTASVILAYQPDTEVTVGDIEADGSNDEDNPYIEVRQGAKLTAHNVNIPGGTALYTDNQSKSSFNDLTGNINIDLSVPDNSGAIVVRGTATPDYSKGSPFIFVTSELSPDETDVLDNMPRMFFSKIANADTYLIDGYNDVSSQDFSEELLGTLRQENFEYIVNVSGGEHYKVNLDTSTLNWNDEYGFYSTQEGNTVKFNVETYDGRAMDSISAGDGIWVDKNGNPTGSGPVADENGYYYIQVPVGGGVFITVKVHKTVEAALWQYYFYGMDPESKEWTYWLCTKVDHGRAKLICTTGFEKVPDNFIKDYCSKEEQDHIMSDGYYLDDALSERLFHDGLKHPIIEVDIFYLGY